MFLQKNEESPTGIKGKSGGKLAPKDGLVQVRELKQQRKTSGTREGAMKKKRLKKEEQKRKMVKGD